MINLKTVVDSDWITVDVIKQMLSQRFKSYEWSLGELIEWCMEVETLFCVNEDLMAKFVDVKLPVQNHMVRKPCNLYRLLDVYSNPDDPTSKISNDPLSLVAWIKLPEDYYDDYVYLTYTGVMADQKTGQVLINRDHRIACFWYCAKQGLMEDAFLGRFPGQSYATIDREFSDACYNAQSISTGRHMQRQDYQNQNIIQGNLLPILGNTTLYKDGMGE